MIRKHLLTLLIGLCIVSCIHLNENGYNQLSLSQKELVIETTHPIDSLPSDGKVYLVSAEQMKAYIGQHKKVVVYEFGAYCHSMNCISPDVAESISHKKGYVLCLLLDSFSHFLEFPKINSPVLAPNPEVFGLKQTQSCIDKMIDELTDHKLGKEDYGRYYVFENGQYLRNISSLNDL